MKKHIFIAFAMLFVFATACKKDLVSDSELSSDSESIYSHPTGPILTEDGTLADPGTRYVLLTKWPKNSLTYYIDNVSNSLTAPQRESIIQTALQRWADVTYLTFTQVSSASAADLKFRWVAQDINHGCGIGNGIIGANTLGHAWKVGTSQQGQICFNDNKIVLVR